MWQLGRVQKSFIKTFFDFLFSPKKNPGADVINSIAVLH